jgi:hypothetical protein
MTDGRLLTLGALGALVLAKVARGSRGVVRKAREPSVSVDLICRPENGLKSDKVFIVTLNGKALASSESSWADAVARALLGLDPSIPDHPTIEAIRAEVVATSVAFDSPPLDDVANGLLDAAASGKGEAWFETYEEANGHAFEEHEDE